MAKRSKDRNKDWLYGDAITAAEVGAYHVVSYIAYRTGNSDIARIIIGKAIKGRGVKGKKYAVLFHCTDGSTPALKTLYRCYTMDKAFRYAHKSAISQVKRSVKLVKYMGAGTKEIYTP